MTKLETAFLRVWEMVHGLTLRPVMQYHFAKPERDWRFDFAWPDHRVAVEIDGGLFVRGGHNRGAQITRDHHKANWATIHGWRVLRYGTKDMGSQKRRFEIAAEVGELLLATETKAKGLFG